MVKDINESTIRTDREEPGLPEGDVPVHSEGHGVHEFGRIRDQSKQCRSQELLVNPRAFQDDVDDVNKQLYSTL